MADSQLSHVNSDGSVQMVDVGGKSVSRREATVEGYVQLQPSHVKALDHLPKGDAITIAQIAGIQGGKKCSDLIPLCHQVPLSKLDVQIFREEARLRIVSTAIAEATTGVEMEAYTAVVVAGITLIDMLKGVHPDLTLTDVRLLQKTGGKSNFKRPL